MKKYFLLIFLITTSCNLTFPQTSKFGWITDTHIGVVGADSALINVVALINERKDLNFVVATGDITDIGMNKDLVRAKEILDKLNLPYFVIPGNHDCKYSESGLSKFSELWKDDKFFFRHGNSAYIGISSGYAWWGHDGHIPPEHLNYLQSILKDSLRNEEVFLFIHHPPDKAIDNASSLFSILHSSNIRMIFCGHGHSNEIYAFSGVPGLMAMSTLHRGNKHGYNIIENSKDSITAYSVQEGGEPVKRFSDIKKSNLNIVPNDSGTYKDYKIGNLIANIDIKSAIVASPVVDRNNIIITTQNGTVYFFDDKGKELRKIVNKSKTFSTPVIQGNYLYLGTMKGEMLKVEITTGATDTLFTVDGAITSRLTILQFLEGAKLKLLLIFGRADGQMSAYNIIEKKFEWITDSSKGLITTKPLLAKGKLVYGAWDGWLYSIDVASGKLNWKWQSKPGFYYSPANCIPLTDGVSVFVVSPDKKVSSIDIETGKTNWQTDSTYNWESLGISNDGTRLLVKSLREKFYILNSSNGIIDKTVNLQYGEDTTPATPIEFLGDYYFGAKNGIIYRVAKSGEFEKLFYIGHANNLGIFLLKDKTFVTASNDGRILIFSLK